MYANSLIRFALPISTPRFKSITFHQTSPKIKLFLYKNTIFSSAWAPPPNLHASGGRGFCPQTPSLQRLGLCPRPPKLLFIANFWIHTWQFCYVYNYLRFCSFRFEQFFLDRSVANLMMLTIDECLMLNCFLLQRFI